MPRLSQPIGRFALGLIAAALLAPQVQAEASLTERLRALSQNPAVQQSCCKTCRKGKACGNSCISVSKSCRKGVGCACNG